MGVNDPTKPVCEACRREISDGERYASVIFVPSTGTVGWKQFHASRECYKSARDWWERRAPVPIVRRNRIEELCSWRGINLDGLAAALPANRGVLGLYLRSYLNKDGRVVGINPGAAAELARFFGCRTVEELFEEEPHAEEGA